MAIEKIMENIVPGIPEDPYAQQIPGEVTFAALTKKVQKPIGEKQIEEAASILVKYKAGKANLERRIVEDERWWQLRHWEVVKKNEKDQERSPNSPKSTSAWLFNAIINKHADMMDNIPEPAVLPRERSDEHSAKILSQVLPVVLEGNDFEKTYSDNSSEKIKHGTAPYGIFWNPSKENGLGEIDVRALDILKLFWEPGVEDIQDSRNFFITDLVDEDLLNMQYPQFEGKLHGAVIDVKQYLYDDTVDTSGKAVVVDWYYKKRSPSGKVILHYAKFVGKDLLFASENEPQYQQDGFYAHGKYPVVMDCLWKEKGTPAGFGYVAICKDPQIYIDALSSNILENSMMATKKRFFVSASTNVNEEEFADWNKPIVHCEGSLDERGMQEITVRPLDPIYVTVMNNKIEELKDTAANRDVNSGGTASGITAASAIAALQEAGNKISRDIISTSYRAYKEICEMCIELMRQFYDETRSFRITGKDPGSYEFVDVSNAEIKDQLIGTDADGIELYRRPVFDLKVSAVKKNPFSRMEQNERAKELYVGGFFNPERAQEALGALEMMDFEGIDKVKAYVQQGQTMYSLVQLLQQELQQLRAMVFSAPPVQPSLQQGSPQASSRLPVNEQGFSSQVMKANSPMTSYGQRLAKRSTPSVENPGSGASPV